MALPFHRLAESWFFFLVFRQIKYNLKIHVSLINFYPFLIEEQISQILAYKRLYKIYRVRQRGCSLTHSARTPPAVHPGITIWVDEVEIEKKKKEERIWLGYFFAAMKMRITKKILLTIEGVRRSACTMGK